MLLHVAALWLQYAELPEEEREGWAKEQGAPSALNKIITTGFKAIHLIYFFTAGADEVKCWQIRKNSKAPQVLHWMVWCICNCPCQHLKSGGRGLVLHCSNVQHLLHLLVALAPIMSHSARHDV